jgi:hypothetical protein
LRAYEPPQLSAIKRSSKTAIIPDLREQNFGWMEAGVIQLPAKKLGILRYMRFWGASSSLISGERFSHVKNRANNSWRIINEQARGERS